MEPLIIDEILIVIYVSADGSKTSATSIVTHALGPITTNLSVILVIILNLVAYFIIFKCLRELYLRLKESYERNSKNIDNATDNNDVNYVTFR